MKSVSTHPVIEDMIICALSGDPIALPQENYATWRPLQKALCSLPQIHVMQGFLPKGLHKYQQTHYTHLGSRRTGKTWAKQLCEKLIKATHSLWLKRNLFEHNRSSHGLREIEDVRLEQDVERQFAIGTNVLQQSDHFLFDKSKI